MTTSKLFSRPVAFRATDDATGPSSQSSLQVLGGINIKKGAYIGTNCIVGGNLAVSSTLPATAIGQAALSLNGGITIAKGIIVSGDGAGGSPFGISLVPNADLATCSINFNSLASGAISGANTIWTIGNNVGSNDSTFSISTSSLTSSLITISSLGPVTFHGTADSTSPTSGSVQIKAGLGVEGTASFGKKASFALGADFSMQRLSNVGPPIDANDATPRAYVDATIQGLDIKDSVKAASVSNVTVTGIIPGTTIDTVVMSTGMRILIKDQLIPSENGIYVIGSGIDPPLRTLDFAVGNTVAGSFTFVEDGSVNINGGFVCVSPRGQDIVGTYPILFTQFAGAGSVAASQPRIRTIGSSDDAVSSTSGGLVVTGGLAVGKSVISGNDIFANSTYKVATEDWVVAQAFAKAAQSNLITFTGGVNISSPTPVTGLVMEDFFNQDVLVRVITSTETKNQVFTLVGYTSTSGSNLDQTSFGDDLSISFTIDDTGQIYYTIGNVVAHVSTMMYWKVIQKTTIVVDPNATSDSTSITTGSTVFKGGVAIQKNLNVGQNIHAQGTVTQSSDIRIKKDISSISDALNLIKQIDGVRYTNVQTEERCVGLIAQQIQEFIPEVVHENGGLLNVSYGNLVGVLVNAIHELSDKVDRLQDALDKTNYVEYSYIA